MHAHTCACTHTRTDTHLPCTSLLKLAKSIFCYTLYTSNTDLTFKFLAKAFIHFMLLKETYSSYLESFVHSASPICLFFFYGKRENISFTKILTYCICL